jgi:hypothetical protein
MATTHPSQSSIPTAHTSEPSKSPGAVGMLLRIFWMLLGHVMLATFAGLILKRGDFSGLDFAYWATVAALVVARYTDITRFGGTTSDGRHPATLDHFHRFALYLIACASAAWIALHAWNVLSAS